MDDICSKISKKEEEAKWKNTVNGTNKIKWKYDTETKCYVIKKMLIRL